MTHTNEPTPGDLTAHGGPQGPRRDVAPAPAEHPPQHTAVARGPADRFDNPGLPPHRPRMTDIDPRAARRARRTIIGLFALSMLGSIGFVVAYFAVPPGATMGSIRMSTAALGACIVLIMFGIGAAAIYWAKSIMSSEELTEQRHPQASSPAVRDAAAEEINAGVQDSGIARRPLLKGALFGALSLAPLAAIFSLGSLGSDWNVSKFRYTLWGKGIRLVKESSGEPIRAADVTLGSVIHVVPENLAGHANYLEEKAKAVVLLVRLDPQLLHESAERATWSYDGIVAYSKICTHVGCPVALYQQQTHHLLCPCHQSTFDVTDHCKVIFGPAKRPLPQLPITVDAEGYLIAQDDFNEPIGPSYWERKK